MPARKFRRAYDKDQHVAALSFLDDEGNFQPGRTKQSHKDETDIRHILRTFDKTGLITHVQAGQQMYGDFTIINEYRENLEFVKRAENEFAELPAEIRKKFQNDPGSFFEFITNPDNNEEMIELGLAERPEETVLETPPAE